MPKVPSSKGGFVQVQVLGVAQTINRLRARNKDVRDGSDLGVFRGANLVQQEWQESIIGNRDEPRRVRTGDYANSPEVDKKSDAIYEVKSDIPYASFLEFGTVRIPPGQHLSNTIERNRGKVREAIDDAIKIKLRTDMASVSRALSAFRKFM